MRRWAVAGGLVIGLLVVVASVVLCEGALRLPPQLKRKTPLPGSVEVSLSVSDGTVLKAGWFDDSKSAATAVLLHGVADARAGVHYQAQMLRRNGFRVLAPDSRGHGLSGGDLHTFGLREVDDLREWVKWVQARYPGQPVYGLGESMGAGILLQAAGAGVPLEAVVAEAPFRTFRDIGVYRVNQKVPGLGYVLVGPAFWYARWRYGLDLSQASPVDAMARIRVPALIIQETNDSNVPAWQGQAVAAAGGPCAELWLVEGDGHTDACMRQPVQFERRIVDFFKKKMTCR